jgi:amino acid adenylation domain-containing protein
MNSENRGGNMFEQMDEILVLTDARFIKQKEYWTKKLSGDITETAILPRFKKSDRSQRDRKARIGIEIPIPDSLAGQLIKFSKKADLSLYLILLAALKSLIYRYTGNEDIIVVSPVLETNISAQTLNDRLFIRDHVNGYMTFKELLIETRQSTLEAYENQDYPFEKIIKYLNSTQIHRDDSFSDVLCLLENIHDIGIIERLKPGLVFSFIKEEEQLKGSILYDPGVFEKNSIQQVSQHFLKILEVSLVDINKKISGISFLSEKEITRLIEGFNNTVSEFPGDKTLQQLFEEQVERAPDNIALVHGNQELSYRELNKNANQLAGLLREKGVNPGCIVGIMSERSIEMIVGILGILKVGGAYLPVDPEYPGARIAYILDDSQVKILLTQDHLSKKVNFCGEVIQLTPKGIYSGISSNLDMAGQPGDLAYIIYTSGSTGNPKGVMIEHAPVVNLAYAQKEEFKINEKDRILQFSSICFDASVEQIFIAFLSGSVLVLADKNTFLDKDKFERFILNYSLTHIHAVPAFLKNIELKGDYKLKRMIAGGDVCPPSLARKWYKNCDFYNEYGPTETTVTSIEFQVKTLDENQPQLPIGKPLNNTRVYFLDRWMRFVPPGAPGEMYIGGAGVARGYQNNPELTMDKFLSNPFREGDRLYRTGDQGCWLPNGNIEFLGRIDHQVKIRGFRIELGEIENELINYRKNVNLAKSFNKKSSTVKSGGGITHCTRCLLSSNYPDIHFDKEGICNICREYKEYKPHAKKYFSDIHDFNKIIEKAKKTSQGDYDCLLLFSGGKDSSYVLYRLVDMGLKVLAFTFDNGYISDIAFENIRRMASKLNVESIICKTDHMKEIFVESLNQDHTVCSGCFKALTTISTRIAAEKNINVIVTGLSRGQIFDTKLYGLFKQGTFDVKEIEEKLLLFRKLYHSTNDRISKLLNVTFDDEMFHQVYFLDFFRYDRTTAEQIKEYLRGKDIYWRQPGDTGFCSTNCIINDVGIYVHLKENGYHNYEAPLSWACRLEMGEREEMLKEIEFAVDLPKVERILEEIGYVDDYIHEAVVVDKEDETGEKYLCAYYVSNKYFPEPGLRTHLSKILPDYMIPSVFIRLDKIPLTPNGKIDRKVLPEPGFKLVDKYVPPTTPVEKKLAEIWAGVLGRESLPASSIGIDDNFFQLGGHSLKATVMIAKIHKEFNLKIPLAEIFKAPTIREEASYIRNMSKSKFVSIQPVEKKEFYVLSSAQKRMFFLNQIDGIKTTYNISFALEIHGYADKFRFENIFRQIIKRHESLRMSFTSIEGIPAQIIHEKVEFQLELKTTDSPDKNRLKQVLEESIQPFSLDKAPLLKTMLIRLTDTENILFFQMHHIISDGISMAILQKEFIDLYKGSQLPKLRIQYKDYAQWQNKLLEKNELKVQEEYWMNKFSGKIPVLNLPAYYPKELERKFEGDLVAMVIGRELTGKIKNIAAETNTTLFILLLSAFNVLLAKYAQQEDIIVGTVIAGRTHQDLNNIVGMFVNTLPIRNYPGGNKSFKDFAAEVKENTLKASENQDYPFEELINKLDIHTGLDRNPLFDVVFTFNNIEFEKLELEDLEIQNYEFEKKISHFDMVLHAVENNEIINLSLEYTTALFKRANAELILNHFVQVLEQAAEDKRIKLEEIKICHDFLIPQADIFEKKEFNFG